MTKSYALILTVLICLFGNGCANRQTAQFEVKRIYRENLKIGLSDRILPINANGIHIADIYGPIDCIQISEDHPYNDLAVVSSINNFKKQKKKSGMIISFYPARIYFKNGTVLEVGLCDNMAVMANGDIYQ
jgi:hypothetical protein